MDQDSHDKTHLARIDERTLSIQQDVIGIQEALVNQYVTQKEFDFVKRLVYYLVFLVMGSWVAGVLMMMYKLPYTPTLP